MTYYMFLDDERDPPEDGREWIVVRSSSDAIEMVQLNGFPEFISFDHDLGGDDTAMLFVRFLMDKLAVNEMERPFTYYVHSQNPIGRDNIIGALDGYDRFSKQNY